MTQFFVGDYETNNLSQWTAQQAAAGRITVVTSPVKQGTRAGRFQANTTDTDIAGSNTYVRCEVYAGNAQYSQATEGREEWWRIAVQWDPTMTNALQPGNDSLMVYQWHHSGPTGPPPMACLTDTGGSGNFGGTTSNPVIYYWKTASGDPNSPGLTKRSLHPLIFGRWYTYVWHVKWSSGSAGLTEVWVDGVKKSSVSGPNMYSGGSIYYKTGLYGTPGRANYVVYNDCHQVYSTPSELGVVVNADGSLTDNQVTAPPPPPPPAPPPPPPPPPPGPTTSLPPGLTLSSAGTISGTPTTGGSYPFTIRVTDSAGKTDTQDLTINVTPIVSTAVFGRDSVSGTTSYSTQPLLDKVLASKYALGTRQQIPALNAYLSGIGNVSPVRTSLVRMGIWSDEPVFPLRAAFYYGWYSGTWTAHNTPTRGFYASTTQSIVDAHIGDFDYAGINVGIASWYQPNEIRDTVLKQSLARTVVLGSDVRWAVYYEREVDLPTAQQIATDLTYIRDNLATSPAYLHVGGKFVVFVNNPTAGYSGADGTGAALVDRYVAANDLIGGDAYLNFRAFTSYQLTGTQPDSWHQYTPTIAEVGSSATGNQFFVISPGYWGQNDVSVTLTRDITRWRANIQNMIASGARWQLVTSYNHWYDATAVESSGTWSSASGRGTYLDELHNQLTVLPAQTESVPGDLLASTAEIQVRSSAAAGFYRAGFSKQPTLNPGNYWLGLGIGGEEAVKYGRESLARGTQWIPSSYSAGLPRVFSATPAATLPTAPTGLVITDATPTSISTAWNAATNNTGYGVYRDNVLVTTTPSTNYTHTGLVCDRSYVLGVDAYDASGNRSARISVTSPTTTCEPAPISGQGYDVVFFDDFTSLSYNNSGSINDAFVWQRPFNGANDAGTVTQSGSSLFMTYTPATATKPILIGTRKNTGNFANSWTYGYFECRSKQPYVIGSYGQIWLFGLFHAWGTGIYTQCNTLSPYTDTTGGKLLTSEIDICEGGWEQGGFGVSGQQQYNTSTHYNTSSPCSVPDVVNTHFVTPGNTFFDNFHTYSVLWTPTTCTYYTDGVQTFSTPTPASANQPMYFLLGNDKHPVFAGPLPATFTHEIDWVRIWQKP